MADVQKIVKRKLSAIIYAFFTGDDGKRHTKIVNRAVQADGIRIPLPLGVNMNVEQAKQSPALALATQRVANWAKSHGLDAPVPRDPFPSPTTPGLFWIDYSFGRVDLGEIDLPVL